MIRKLAMSAAVMASCTGLLLPNAPAMAQSRADDARFEAAQRRLDDELDVFRGEFERYQRARAGAPQAGREDRGVDAPRAPVDEPQPRDESRARDDDPRNMSDAPRAGSDDPSAGSDDPRGAGADPQRGPDDRDERGEEPPPR